MGSPKNKNNTIYILIGLAAVAVLGWIGYTKWQESKKQQEAEVSRDIDKVQEAIKSAKEDLAKQFRTALANIPQPQQQKDYEEYFTNLNKAIGDAEEKAQARIGELEQKLREAQQNGDKAAAEQLEKSLEEYRKLLEHLQKQLEETRQELARRNEEGQPPEKPGPEDPITQPPPTTTTTGDDDDDEAIGALAKIALVAICYARPELCAILGKLGLDIGLFGGDTELRDTYLEAVTDIAAGRPVDPATLEKLEKAARAGLLDKKQFDDLKEIISKLPQEEQDKLKPFVDRVEKIYNEMRSGSQSMFVKQVIAAVEDDKPLDDVRKLFTTVEGNPKYENKADKEQLEKYFGQTGKEAQKADYWDNAEKGLSKIEVKGSS